MKLRIWLTAGALVLGLGCVHVAAAKKPKKAPVEEVKPPPAPPVPVAKPALMAKAEVKLADGRKAGDLTLEQTPGGVVISGDLENLPPGIHAFHIHETGKCEAPFKTAGGHFNPEGHKHGIRAEGGKHAGDLPNLHVPDSGKVHVELFAADLSLDPSGKNTVFDADGSAFIVHEKIDDLQTDPTGNAGGRIACGLIIK